MFKNSNDFSLHIETLAAAKQMNHIDAIMEFCAQHMIEPTDVVNKINKNLRDKIEQDARDLNYLPKVAQLEL